MDLILKPKNYYYAIHFFTYLPFYSFKQCLQRDEVIFKQDEILDIRLDKTKSYVLAFSYQKEGFSGLFVQTQNTEKLYVHNFPGKEIVEKSDSNRRNKAYFLFSI